jgi:DNA-binding response OmpR family regulator
MLTVLVIDDDPSLRDTIGLFLEKEGFRPVLAEDGKIGLSQALTLKPSLIVVDLRMPGMSGVEVCRQVRAAGMNTPLIVLSAISDEIDKVLLLEIGADDYTVKPFGTRELLARISDPATQWQQEPGMCLRRCRSFAGAQTRGDTLGLNVALIFIHYVWGFPFLTDGLFVYHSLGKNFGSRGHYPRLGQNVRIFHRGFPA